MKGRNNLTSIKNFRKSSIKKIHSFDMGNNMNLIKKKICAGCGDFSWFKGGKRVYLGGFGMVPLQIDVLRCVLSVEIRGS